MATRVDLQRGELIGGYRVERLLGRGGMSTVYVARDLGLDRDVALKVISPELAEDVRFIARFRRESRLAAALEHTAVVPVYEAGEAEGSFFIAMRLVRGRDLRATLLERGPLDPTEALAMLTPIAEALDAAHALGLVHRDVKPGNILVGEDGRTFLADFGLTKSTAATTVVSHTGQLVGTTAYVAPEQIRGDEVDGRADQYSLACVLFECVTGRPPFARDSELATLWAHVEEVAPLPSALRPEVPRTLDEAVAVSLSKEPEARFASCARFLLRAGAGAQPAAPARGPFVGLAAFDTTDAPYFFGRERLVAEVAARVSDGGFVALVGPSGSGKSSLLRAGLIPALAQNGHRHVLVRPGERPAAALAEAMGDSLEDARGRGAETARLVLAVDPVEEIFTACADDEERAAFVSSLVRAASDSAGRVGVLAVIRADYFGDCAAYAELAALLSGRTVLVGAMSRDELARVVEGPAARTGIVVERALTEALVEDVADEPGALPLLSTALQELWLARQDGRLTLRAYERSGGVRGAVARLAEEAYARLGPGERAAARRILLRLADVRAGGQAVRRRVRVDELDVERDTNTQTALAALTRERLVIVDEGSVDVVHEALFREWPRLRDWLDASAESLLVRRRLSETAAAWEAGGRDPADLIRGARLAATLDWETAHGAELNEAERTYLTASRAAAESEELRERRANRRLRILLAAAAILLAAAAAGVVVALAQRASARSAAVRADVQKLAALSRSQQELDRSLLLARQAVQLSDSTEARGTLLAALARAPSAIRILRPPLRRPVGLAAAPDGSRLLVWNDQHAGVLLETHSGRTIARPTLSRGRFTADGHEAMLITERAVAFADAQTGTTLRTWRWPVQSVRHRDVSPDGGTALAVSGDGREIFVWDTRTSRLRNHVSSTIDKPFVLAVFAPDGRRVVSVSRTRGPSGALSYAVWNEGEARPASEIPASHSSVAPVLSPDGRLLVERASEIGAITFVDFLSGSRRASRERHAKAVAGLAFSPDGRMVASAGDDGAIMLWNPRTGGRVDVLRGHAGRARSPAFADRGRVLYTASTDGAVIAWDVAGGRRFGRPFRASEGLRSDEESRIAVSPDGSWLAATQRGGVAVTDARTLARVATLQGAGRQAAPEVAFGSDGAVAVAGPGPAVVVWRRRDWRPVRTLRLPARNDRGAASEAVAGLAFSPDGALLAAATRLRPNGAAGRAVTWRLSSGRASVRELFGALGDVAFSPDGELLAVALNDPAERARVRFGGFAAVLDADTLAERYRVDVDSGYGGARAVAFSPDGRLLATAGGVGEVRFFDAETGRQRGQTVLAGTGWLLSLDFSPGGKTLVAAGADGAVRLVDVEERTQIGPPLVGLPVPPAVAAFSPVEERLFAVGRNGSGIRWDLSLERLEEHACRVAGRNLTRAEWELFLPSRPYAPACT